MIPSLCVLCGIQGSGKSTYAKKMLGEFYRKTEILSSDEIRKKHPEYDNDRVFNELYYKMNKLLGKNVNVIIDATNTTVKSRKHIFEKLNQPCYKVCCILNVPYEICLERVRLRNKNPKSHYVPEDVVEKYYKSFEIPFNEEGWDTIHFAYDTIKKVSDEYLNELNKKAETFNQNNKHHTQLLGEHMRSVSNYLKNKKDSNQYIDIHKMLIESAKYHDVGKLFTQTYKEGDDNAHYYGHANVGAYNLMCYCHREGMWGRDYDDTLNWLFYINYHMYMHNITTEKSEKKWKEIFGEFKYAQLKRLHEADVFRGDVETPKSFEVVETSDGINPSMTFKVGDNDTTVHIDPSTLRWTYRPSTQDIINQMYNNASSDIEF